MGPILLALGILSNYLIFEECKDSRILADQVKYASPIVRRNGHLENVCSYYQNTQFPYPSIVFDFCLGALEGDVFDAKLYLTHSFHLLGPRRRLALLLSVITNDSKLRLD